MRVLSLLVLALIALCFISFTAGVSAESSMVEAEGDIESNVAIEWTNFAEVDSEADADTDADVDSEADVDTDAQTEAEADAAVDAAIDAEADAEFQAESAVESRAMNAVEMATSAEHYTGVAWTSQIQGAGCGSGITTAITPDWNMKPACVAHDACYDNCNTNKANCDTTFKTNMVKLCDQKYTKKTLLSRAGLRICKMQADLYYAGVDALGAKAWKNAKIAAKCAVIPKF